MKLINTVLFLVALLTLSACGEEGTTEPEISNNALVGNWNVVKEDSIVYTYGENFTGRTFEFKEDSTFVQIFQNNGIVILKQSGNYTYTPDILSLNATKCLTLKKDEVGNSSEQTELESNQSCVINISWPYEIQSENKFVIKSYKDDGSLEDFQILEKQ